MPSEIHPLVFVRAGRLVRPEGPRSWTPTTDSRETTVKAIKQAALPESSVYVYDVDGVEAGAPDHELYQALERAHVPLWIEPGCRSPEDAMDAFFAGAERLTVSLYQIGRNGLHDLGTLAEGEVHLGFPFTGRTTSPPLRAFEIQRLATENELGGVLFQPGPEADAHALTALAGELKRQGLVTSLVERRPGSLGPTLHPEAFDHLIGPTGESR